MRPEPQVTMQNLFSFFSQGLTQKVFTVSLTTYKEIFFKQVAPSIKTLLFMILHCCYFENWRTSQRYDYLQISNKKTLRRVSFLYFFFSFCNYYAKNAYGLLLSFKATEKNETEYQISRGKQSIYGLILLLDL